MTSMERDTLERLALGNRVDLAAVRRVEAELEALRRAGLAETSRYAITPPLGRVGLPTRTRELANRRPVHEADEDVGPARR